MAMIHRTSRRRLAAVAVQLAVALVVVTGTVVLVDAAPASAHCSHNWQDRDPGSDQVSGASGGLRMRTGPHTSCGVVTTIPNGRWVTLYCWTRGDTVSGNSFWSRVRYGNGAGTWDGWVSDHYLAGGGAREAYPCLN